MESHGEPLGSSFIRLAAIMSALRGEGGCPWDREQTHSSLRPYLLEEAHEVLEAVDSGQPARLREELGDLLLQVVFHAELARQAGQFDIDGVVGAIADKLIRRHPHVFASARADTPDQVLANWEAIKHEEREGDGSLFDGVPRALPSLLRAQRVQAKASRVGFDWGSVAGAMAKVEEEWGELRRKVGDGGREALEEELGDLLFAVVNVARFLKVDAENALRGAVAKFIRRFRFIEEELARRGRSVHQATLEEMDALWDAAKKRENP